MDASASKSDKVFRDRFEAGEVPPQDFHHREHLRLAYVYLCEDAPEQANARMRSALKSFLDANGVPPEKYHETLTYSWILAVRHFMERAGYVGSFDAFLACDDRLLDTEIMLTHYKRDTLFSDEARTVFVAPDVQDIPLH